MTENDAPSISRKSAGLVSAVIWAFGLLFYFKLPQNTPLFIFTELTILLGFFPWLFWWQTKSTSPKKFATITCAGLWIIGIALAFVIPTTSMFAAIPDALLLLGFFPLLFLWRFSFPWMIFGVIDIGIGVLLQTIEFLPDDPFPAELRKAKAHLAEYHPPLTWYTLGAISLLFGWSRFIKNMVLLIRRRQKPKE